MILSYDDAMTRINYDIKPEIAQVWREYVLKVNGNQRGGREMIEEAMLEYLGKRGVNYRA